jgi:hypothetical protein
MFGKLFNALNIQRNAGMRIHWTDNLNNYLRLVGDDTELCILHQGWQQRTECAKFLHKPY